MVKFKQQENKKSLIDDLSKRLLAFKFEKQNSITLKCLKGTPTHPKLPPLTPTHLHAPAPTQNNFRPNPTHPK